MESKPHVPGYNKEGKNENLLAKEMTMEELDALEVPEIEVVKRGVVQSKLDALKKKSPLEERQVQETLQHQIDALMMQPVKTEIEKRIRDLKIQKVKEKMEK